MEDYGKITEDCEKKLEDDGRLREDYGRLYMEDYGKKKAEVRGYIGLSYEEVPETVLSAAEANGWEHFGRAEGIPEVFIAGPNKATHLQTAKRVKAELGRSDVEDRPEDDSHSQLPEKSGGVKAWFEDGALRIEASRYDKFGADPKLTEAEGCQSFLAQVCLKGLWWSPGTHAARRQSSERCVQVLFGLRGLGKICWCPGLSKNDLDDEFLVELLNLLRATRSTLDALNLDENRITELLPGVQLRSCLSCAASSQT